MSKSTTKRYRLTVRGIVQGVGFRPFVYKLANRHELGGWVNNSLEGVIIEVEGTEAATNVFQRDLRNAAPPMADILEIAILEMPTTGEANFVIQASGPAGHTATWIAPDIGLCRDCLAEFSDSTDRRYHYPFINCTNCGPRYTIIENIPYDRPLTAMRNFRMCTVCQTEYDDPTSRRFHAQPNACPACGPQLELRDSGGQIIAGLQEAATRTREALRQGKIIAIKGVGGFHLAVNGQDDQAVQRLRQRKGRAAKPLAVMAADLKMARCLGDLSAEEEQALSSPAAPIVLARKLPDHGLAKAVAPGNELLGIMLPYTPLHHLLFEPHLQALVMTSANFSEEPLCAANDEALTRLAKIADLFLLHDRDIFLPNDDSVVMQVAGQMRQIRRSRGYVPRPIKLSSSGPPVLAVGWELKNTVCLLKNDQAVVSQHLGDLKNLEGYRFFTKTIDHLTQLFTAEPELIIHDLHPGYLSSRWAKEEQDKPTLAVQHHHAHLAACLAENQHEGPAIGIIMDGTGHGPDNTIWGGELLIGDTTGFERFASFAPMPLPGGDRAVAEPWRAALGYLHHVFEGQIPDLPFLDQHQTEPVLEILAKDLNCPKTSSCGRLFDAVAAMAGGRQTIQYEAQTAIEFMQVAGGNIAAPPFDYDVSQGQDRLIMEVTPIIRAVVKAVREGTSLGEISGRLHRTLVELFSKAATLARTQTGLNTVALSGGVFQNHLLLPTLINELEREGFTVLSHSLLPSNDGCLSLGQAVIGRTFLL